MKLKIVTGIVFASCCFAGMQARGASTNELPKFDEVFELLRANLAGTDPAELDRAAVKGLLSQLQSLATLSGESKDSPGGTPAAMRTAMFDNAYGYVRIGEVAAGTDKQVKKAWQQLSSSNQLKGIVIDLRFAGGSDYAAAAALADLFFTTEKPLLDFGDGMRKSTAKTDAFSLPLAVLVNRQTTGAAEAFAGVLRHADVGLLIGTNTAGKATIGKEFPLKTGQRLWIATSLVKLANGKSFPSGGLQPDIQVEVSPQDEQAYFEDAYKLLPKAGHVAGSSTNINLSVTNRLPRRRTSEAELVRMHRDGELPDPDAAPPRNKELPPQVVYDPALARAIDLLKGLAVVQQFRSI
jgi:hypothetical protein